MQILVQLIDHHPEERDDMKAMLRWLVGAMAPLTLEEIAEGISLRDGDKALDGEGIATDPTSLASLLGSLIIVQQPRVDARDKGKNISNDQRASTANSTVEE